MCQSAGHEGRVTPWNLRVSDYTGSGVVTSSTPGEQAVRHSPFLHSRIISAAHATLGLDAGRVILYMGPAGESDQAPGARPAPVCRPTKRNETKTTGTPRGRRISPRYRTHHPDATATVATHFPTLSMRALNCANSHAASAVAPPTPFWILVLRSHYARCAACGGTTPPLPAAAACRAFPQYTGTRSSSANALRSKLCAAPA